MFQLCLMRCVFYFPPGQKLTLNCTVLCGQNAETECSAHWSSSDRVEDQGFKNKRYITSTEL